MYFMIWLKAMFCFDSFLQACVCYHHMNSPSQSPTPNIGSLNNVFVHRKDFHGVPPPPPPLPVRINILYVPVVYV